MLVVEFKPELHDELVALKEQYPGLVLVKSRGGAGIGGDTTMMIHMAELGVMAIQAIVIAWIKSGKATAVKVNGRTYTNIKPDDVVKIEEKLDELKRRS